MTGKISVHPRGFGFVSIVDSSHPDVFIPSSKLKGAIDGDIVEILVYAQSKKGFEGEVTKVDKQNRKRVVGSVVEKGPKDSYLIYAPVVGEEREIVLQKSNGIKLEIGDRLLVKIENSEDGRMTCKMEAFLGHIENAKIDTEIAILENELREKFPKNVLKEVESFPKELPFDKKRTDFTKITTVTIDPIDARDYDDALSCTKDANGHYHLGVHIADVSHFVKSGSALDDEAFMRANSTYFIDSVIPMLPKELSNELCSLKEGVIRYTASIVMEFDPTGNMVDYKVSKGMIKSAKRFTYEEAKEVLDGKIPSPHKGLLELFVELCRLLKKARYDRGSVELSTPEIRLQIGEDGVPTGTRVIEYDITHQLVEEFMLKANESVAKHLDALKKKSLFRIHEEPELETMKEFFTYARLLGLKAGSKMTPQDIQELFREARDSPMADQLAVRYIRSMKLAIYSSDNIGHYGLSLQYYTHFTSPIRRYSDLVIHRLLFDKKYEPDLPIIAEHCSTRERCSFRAEMGVLRLKKIRFLDRITEVDPNKVFEATITNIKPQGLFFDLNFLSYEGFIHISEICDDYLEYSDKTVSLKGTKTGISFSLGQRIQVQLESIDLVFQETSWSIYKEAPTKKKSRR